MAYTNSKLVNYKRLSPNHSGLRNQKISKITIHHMAGNLTVEQCGAIFAPVSRQASSNYGIGTDGRIGMYVEEKNRSWCSSSAWNDNRAITIEVANDKPSDAGGWHVSNKAMKSLINLCVDICKRNGIPKLTFTGDTNGTLTFHYMYASTACPGPYLKSKAKYICNEVNKKLNTKASTAKPVSKTTVTKAFKPYVAQVTVSELWIRQKPDVNSKKVGTILDKGAYTIVKESKGPGSKKGWGKLKSGAGWIALDYVKKIK